MIALLCDLASAAALAWAALTHPTHARCPRRWWLEGVRPSGRFDCRRVPIGDDAWTVAQGERDASVQPEGVLYGRVYCGAGQRPIATWTNEVRCAALSSTLWKSSPPHR